MAVNATSKPVRTLDAIVPDGQLSNETWIAAATMLNCPFILYQEAMKLRLSMPVLNAGNWSIAQAN
jgi:hypothetical protein